ncbi:MULTISPECIES: hypothetical protein [Nocardia]|nr:MULTISPECIES: hypothetical protein [Nocardia]
MPKNMTLAIAFRAPSTTAGGTSTIAATGSAVISALAVADSGAALPHVSA